MPFRRKYAPRRSAYRRPYAPRKYGKKYGRRRFTKKRFARNNVNQLTMRAPLASRLLRVKLPWVKTFESDVIAPSGSQSWAFQGNGLVPYTVSGQTGNNNPAVGDTLPAGEVEYSQFYDKYVINGSSIKIEAVNPMSTNTSSVYRCVLLAIPFTIGQPGSFDDWPANKAQLDSYTYEQLLAWPYAKWRMLASNTGGASRLIFKMFRKTKHMCGIKDLLDNYEYSAHLTDGTTTVSAGLNPNNGFMYYFRIFRDSGTGTGIPIQLTVRMSLYVTMINREFNPTQNIVSP